MPREGTRKSRMTTQTEHQLVEFVWIYDTTTQAAICYKMVYLNQFWRGCGIQFRLCVSVVIPSPRLVHIPVTIATRICFIL
jgi:hypothetical protein